MKKKFLITILSLVCVLTCALALVACGGGGEYTPPEPEIGPTPTSVTTVNGADYIGVVSWSYADGNVNTEFKLDDGEWLDTHENAEMIDGHECSLIWRNLTPGTTHTLYARSKSQENGAVVSGDSYKKEITLDKLASQDKPEVTVQMTDGKTVKIVGFTEEMEASFTLENPNGERSGSDGFIGSDTFTFSENGYITVRVQFKENATTIFKEYLSLYARATDFGGGTGSEEDPFLIYNYEQLVAMGTQDDKYMPHYAYFRLENDIVCPDKVQEKITCVAFTNYLDGNGKKITGVNVEAPLGGWENGAALFDSLSGVENLVVENAQIKALIENDRCSGNISMGIIAGSVKGNVKNCKVSGTLELFVREEGEDFAELLDSIYLYAGGIAGTVWENIEGCNADVKIILPDAVIRRFAYTPYCGGLAGSSGNISLSSADVTLYGGEDGGSNILAVSNGINFGGLVGSLNSEKSIENCYAQARLDVQFVRPSSRADRPTFSYVGGLVGKAEKTIIKNSYSSFLYRVVTEDALYGAKAGGLTGGSVAALENCFVGATFNIEGFSEPATDALAASFESGAGVINCYYVNGTTAAEEGATQVTLSDLRDMEWQKQNLAFSEDVWLFHDFHTENEKFYPTLKHFAE